MPPQKPGSLDPPAECPFLLIRKTNPQADLGTFTNHIIRTGIPYGPEVTNAEAASGISDNTLERGLAFVAYQSNIGSGFQSKDHGRINQALFSGRTYNLDLTR